MRYIDLSGDSASRNKKKERDETSMQWGIFPL